MTSLLVPWLVFPLVMTALSLGCGLLVEWACGRRLPGTLLLPCGMCFVIVASLFAILSEATATLATPAVVASAVAGLGLGAHRLRRAAVDLWALGCALGAFAVYAAPVVLSGSATFPGYLKLDDDATFLANLDRAMEHGRSLAGLEPSSYLATLQPHLAKGYPLGAVMPIGVGGELVREDTMWLYQPFLAFMAALLALGLYELTARVIDARWLRALAAFVGAQSALLYGYGLWGGLKEVAAAAVIALVAVLVVPAIRDPGSPRSLFPLALVSASLLGILSVGGGVWLVPPLAAALVVVVLTRTRATAWRAIAAFAGFAVVLAIPTIAVAPSFFGQHVFKIDYLANLLHPLSISQLGGIWLAGDFRITPDQPATTYVLVALVVVAAIGGLAWAWSRRAWELPLYVVGVIVSCFVFFPFSTPWIEGKALATAATALPLAAVVGAAALLARGRRVEAGLLAALVAGGVLWSNALQYHEAWLAPRGQLEELESIGNRYAGQGPSLMTEFHPYGARHFLRKLDAEGASELRIRQVPLRTGQLLAKGAYADIDDFSLDAVLTYRTLVLRRSPLESRPPSPYQLVWRGGTYEVWQRPELAERTILEHRPLGSGGQATAVPDCADVLRLAEVAGTSGQLAAVERPAGVIFPLARGSYPESWGMGRAGELVPAGAGTVTTSVRVPAEGRYSVWLGGSIRDQLEVAVDGRIIGSVRNELNNRDQYTSLGQVELDAGTHVVALRYGGPDLRPGSGGQQFAMGPLVLSRTTDVPVTYLRPEDAGSLCGRSLDWIEALGA